jgi:ABC-type sugar transport system permease subunit
MTNNLKLNQTLGAKGARPKKKKIASLDRRKARAGWIFVLPFIIGFVLIYLPMVFESLKLSFHEIKYLPGGGFEEIPVGFENYAEAFLGEHGESFIKALGSGLLQMLFDIPAILIFSLFMAVLLNQKMVGRAAFRAIFFVPVVLSTGIMEAIDGMNTSLSDYMGDSSGIDDGSGSSAAAEIVTALDVQKLFAGMKIGTKLTSYVVSMVNDIFNIVNRSGVQMLIFLAALQSISPAIYESCRIDGATSWETFWKITLPMISPMILVNGVYTVIDSFTTDSNIVMKYVASVATEGGGETLSSAMAWVYFMIIILIVALIAAIFSAFVFYQKRDM